MTTNSCISCAGEHHSPLDDNLFGWVSSAGFPPATCLVDEANHQLWPRPGEGGPCLQEKGEGESPRRSWWWSPQRVGSKLDKMSCELGSTGSGPTKFFLVFFVSPVDLFFLLRKPLHRQPGSHPPPHAIWRETGLVRRWELAGGAGQGRALAKSLCICIILNPGRAETSRTLPRHDQRRGMDAKGQRWRDEWPK
jgi:hypothetical protein